MAKIKGKQIADNTITQNNLTISTSSIVSSTDVTNKEYVESVINSGMTNLSYSSADLNVAASVTSGTDPILATTRQVSNIPIGGIRIFVNGLEVNVGSGLDCFFAPEGSGTPTPREFGLEQQNDYLWWNPTVASYQLEATDSIDFVYMVYTLLV